LKQNPGHVENGEVIAPFTPHDVDKASDGEVLLTSAPHNVHKASNDNDLGNGDDFFWNPSSDVDDRKSILPSAPLDGECNRQLQNCVSNTCMVSSIKEHLSNLNESELNRTLADHIFYHSSDYSSFYETMSLFDPKGDGNCGFNVLKMFLFCLNEHEDLWHGDTKALRQYVVKALKEGKEYFRTSKILALMQRGPGIPDKTWEEVMPVATAAVEDDIMEPPSDDNLFMIDSEGRDEGDWVIQMGNEHLEVFARATKTRIVLLHYWEDNQTKILRHTSSNKFTCLVIDHRDGRLDPKDVFSNAIPKFDETYDFFRTAVIMNAPVCIRVTKNSIVWPPGKAEDRHFSMWVPDKYNPRRLPKPAIEKITSNIRIECKRRTTADDQSSGIESKPLGTIQKRQKIVDESKDDPSGDVEDGKVILPSAPHNVHKASDDNVLGLQNTQSHVFVNGSGDVEDGDGISPSAPHDVDKASDDNVLGLQIAQSHVSVNGSATGNDGDDFFWNPSRDDRESILPTAPLDGECNRNSTDDDQLSGVEAEPFDVHALNPSGDVEDGDVISPSAPHDVHKASDDNVLGLQIAQSHEFVNGSASGNDGNDFFWNPSRDVDDLDVDYPPQCMLRYPFNGDTEEMERLAIGLWGLGGASEAKEPTTEFRERGHFVHIHEHYLLRLDPGNCLNDELVDLWMLWYVSYSKTSIVIFFQTHHSF
jgi:hypothetical protein